MNVSEQAGKGAAVCAVSSDRSEVADAEYIEVTPALREAGYDEFESLAGCSALVQQDRVVVDAEESVLGAVVREGDGVVVTNSGGEVGDLVHSHTVASAPECGYATFGGAA